MSKLSMSKLSESKCEACRVGAPLLTGDTLAELMLQIPGWSVVDVEGVPQLERIYTFKNFVEAMVFANSVGHTAEDEGHHPTLLVEWGRVKINWWTHKIHGLHQNDVIMAAKCDAILKALWD